MSSPVRLACLVLALAGMTEIGAAQAATCRVPRAILCAGCAERVVIRLGAGGVCRVTFTPTSATTGADGFMDLDIAAGEHGAKRRVATTRPTRRASQPRLGNRAAGCFSFNGRQFCE